MVGRFSGRRLVLICLAICYIALITILSVVKVSDIIDPQPPEYDELLFWGFYMVHFCFYFGLNTLLLSIYFTSRSYCDVVHLLPMIGITMCAIAYSVLMEVIQSQIGREFSLTDILANVGGGVVALLLFRMPIVKRLLCR